MSCSTFCASTDEISRERRSLNGARLEALDLNGVHWQTPETFDDERRCLRRCAPTSSSGLSRSAEEVAICRGSAAG